MPKGIQIGFQIAEKNANTQTHTHINKHFRIYISRAETYSQGGDFSRIIVIDLCLFKPVVGSIIEII